MVEFIFPPKNQFPALQKGGGFWFGFWFNVGVKRARANRRVMFQAL